MAKSAVPDKQVGGVKGLFMRGYDRLENFRSTGGKTISDVAFWLAKSAGQLGFVLATTSMVVLMPLFFEIARERQMLETERSIVKDLRSQGYHDNQLTDMGITRSAIFSPSVASSKD